MTTPTTFDYALLAADVYDADTDSFYSNNVDISLGSMGSE